MPNLKRQPKKLMTGLEGMLGGLAAAAQLGSASAWSVGKSTWERQGLLSVIWARAGGAACAQETSSSSYFPLGAGWRFLHHQVAHSLQLRFKVQEGCSRYQIQDPGLTHSIPCMSARRPHLWCEALAALSPAAPCAPARLRPPASGLGSVLQGCSEEAGPSFLCRALHVYEHGLPLVRLPCVPS